MGPVRPIFRGNEEDLYIPAHKTARNQLQNQPFPEDNALMKWRLAVQTTPLGAGEFCWPKLDYIVFTRWGMVRIVRKNITNVPYWEREFHLRYNWLPKSSGQWNGFQRISSNTRKQAIKCAQKYAYFICLSQKTNCDQCSFNVSVDKTSR